MNDLPSLGIKGMDKYVHFTFHFVFTVLWAIVVKSRFATISNKKILNIILISLVMGITIEILQENFTTTRKADILDVMANLTGAISAGILMSFFENKKIIN
jgi:VanZ family protein